MKPSEFFRFCPACGVASQPAARPSPYECASCGFTYYFNAAIATATFLRRPDGRQLFVVRAREPEKGKLAPPGGFVDIGETAEEAARREVREEVGLEMGTLHFLGSFPNEYLFRAVNYPVLDFFFEAEAVRPESAVANDDAESLCWLDPEGEVTPEQLAFPSMRRALEVVRRRRREGREGEASRSASHAPGGPIRS